MYCYVVDKRYTHAQCERTTEANAHRMVRQLNLSEEKNATKNMHNHTQLIAYAAAMDSFKKPIVFFFLFFRSSL